MAHERTSRAGITLVAMTIYLPKKLARKYRRASKLKYGKPNKNRLIVETLTRHAPK